MRWRVDWGEYFMQLATLTMYIVGTVACFVLLGIVGYGVYKGVQWLWA